jgi:hypothetical protein
MKINASGSALTKSLEPLAAVFDADKAAMLLKLRSYRIIWCPQISMTFVAANIAQRRGSRKVQLNILLTQELGRRPVSASISDAAPLKEKQWNCRV